MLDKIVSCQNTISLDNYKVYIRQIMIICPLTYIVLDGNVIQLVDNNTNFKFGVRTLNRPEAA